MARDSIPNYILSQLAGSDLPEIIRILDIGCGKGDLMQQMHNVLHEQLPGMKFEIYGLEVAEHAGQKEAWIGSHLDTGLDIDWNDRINVISDTDSWPYDDGFFDCVVSHSVIEHVRDQELFFKESARVLNYEGFAVHSLPVKERIIDGHFNLMLIHKLRDYDLIWNFIYLSSVLGFGKYKLHASSQSSNQQLNIEDYATQRANYAFHRLNYISISEFQKISKKYGFKSSRTRYLLSRFKRRKNKNKTGRYKKSDSYFELVLDYFLSVYIARFANLVFILER